MSPYLAYFSESRGLSWRQKSSALSLREASDYLELVFKHQAQESLGVLLGLKHRYELVKIRNCAHIKMPVLYTGNNLIIV